MSEETEMTLAKVRAWAKQLHEQGQTLKLLWDGGGDSGWVHFQIDNEEADTPETKFLVDMCYEILDYGSWAGEFNASGEAEYDPEEEAFVGIDDYATDEYHYLPEEEQPIIKVPASINFTAIEIESDRESEAVVHIHQRHGFRTAEYAQVERAIGLDVDKQGEKLVAQYVELPDGNEYDHNYNSGVIRKEAFTLSEDGTEYVARWENFSIQRSEVEEKSICLSLKDTHEDE